jgi:hypothetical protein
MADLTLDPELVGDLLAHLELGVRGAIPNPEHAGQLLRRFRTAMVESQRGSPRPNRTGTTRPSAPEPA